MPAAPEAILQDHEGRPMLRFERRLRHSPERVWRALTEADELASWHPSAPRFEPKAGGAVSFEDRYLDSAQGEITEYEPPRVLAHTWGEDHLRWEIEPTEGGCVLVLLHVFDDRFKAARDAAGWQVCIDSLVSLLEGRPSRPEGDADSPPGEWERLNRAYQERFGIAPEKATPIPEVDA